MMTRTAVGLAGLGFVFLLLSLGGSGCVKRLSESDRPCPCAQGWACNKLEGEPGVCVEPGEQDAGVFVLDGPKPDVIALQDGNWGERSSDSAPPPCENVLPEHTGGSWENLTESIAQQVAHSSAESLRVSGWFQAIWGSSAKDIYLLGPAGGILHFDGSTWSVAHTQMYLSAIWGSGPNDVFAVGQVMDSVSDKSSLILHYDGVSWTKMVSNTLGMLNGVWGSGPNDVFAVGTPLATSEPVPILHYDGKNWTPMASGIVGGQLSAVWGSAPRDIYAVGTTDVDGTPTGLILHYDGSAWRKAASYKHRVLTGLWGSGPEDVYAVGYAGGNESPVLHFDGTSWKTMPTAGGYCDYSIAVWGSGPHNVWAVGSRMWHFDGSSWDQVSLPGVLRWLGVWGSGSGDVWVVEEGGDAEGVWHYRAQQ